MSLQYFYSTVAETVEARDRGDGVYAAQLPCMFHVTQNAINRWGSQAKCTYRGPETEMILNDNGHGYEHTYNMMSYKMKMI